MAAGNSPPSLQILVRGPEGFSVWRGPPFGNGEPTVQLQKVPCNRALFCEDGSRLMVIKSDSVISIYDCKAFKEIRSFEIPNTLAATLSPCGSYLQTFQKPVNPQEKNVSIWKIDGDTPVYQHFQKNMTTATWPSILFSSDETVACRMVTNEIQFFDGKDFSKGIFYRLKVPKVAGVELSKPPTHFVAAYVPESKGIPASVQIFACRENSQGPPVARRSFFRSSTVQLTWNCCSTGLLVLVQSDVDKTNQSYYGESKLHYLTTDGTHEGLVPLSKEGPVHDVQWSSSGSEFAVVYGFMPAKATIFDKKCNPLLELGTGPYNTIRWNPKGKCFGNLPGDMAFWDYTERKQLRAAKAEWSVTSEWSPDGCYFMTATTAPRLQIDNGIKIFHYDGSLYFKKMFDKLYQADWKSESPDRFGEISELVKSLDTMKIEESKKQGQGSKLTGSSQKPTSSTQASKPAAYQPPHAKKAAAAQSQLFGGSPSEEVSKNALRNKKKREKQREKKAAEAASAANST